MADLHTAPLIADADLADDNEFPIRLSGATGLLKATLAKIRTWLVDTDGAMTANSDLKVPSQKAVVTKINAAIAAALVGFLDLKGGQDCSANPNYPAAVKGDYYFVTVAGKIGGAAGKAVSVGDVFFATADNAGGDQATVGASWDVMALGSSGGGGSSGANPSLVQYAVGIGNSGSATFATAPTAGNLLVAIGTHWSAVAIASGWVGIANLNGSDDGYIIATKIAASGESVTQSPWGACTGAGLAIFEITNFLESMFYNYIESGDTPATTGRTVKLGIPHDGALVVGIASSVLANAAPSSITGPATIEATVTGTSTSGSQRQVTPFVSSGLAKGSITITSAYAASNVNYLMAVVITNR